MRVTRVRYEGEDSVERDNEDGDNMLSTSRVTVEVELGEGEDPAAALMLARETVEGSIRASVFARVEAKRIEREKDEAERKTAEEAKKAAEAARVAALTPEQREAERMRLEAETKDLRTAFERVVLSMTMPRFVVTGTLSPPAVEDDKQAPSVGRELDL